MLIFVFVILMFFLYFMLLYFEIDYFFRIKGVKIMKDSVYFLGWKV